MAEYPYLQLESYINGTSADNQQITKLLYPDLFRSSNPDIEHDYDILTVDRSSLANYIAWVISSARKYSSEKRIQALRQARIVFAVISTFDGLFPQRKKPSPFGRMYYEGISVQSVNKELRAAMLGNCWEYDIRSSVISWKMGFADKLAAQSSKSVREMFPATLLYLESKAAFIMELRQYVFDSQQGKEASERLIKQALTAISFGARNRTHGWRVNGGDWQNPALVDIIKNESDRKKFLAYSLIRDFIQEQNVLDNYLYQDVKTNSAELLKKSALQTRSGKGSKAKVIAFLYQHSERDVMDLVAELAAQSNRKVLARVHDAIFLRHRLGLDLTCEIERAMREKTGNPFWHLTAKQIERYELPADFYAAEELAHRRRIAEEEKAAQLGRPRSWVTDTFVVMDSKHPLRRCSPAHGVAHGQRGHYD